MLSKEEKHLISIQVLFFFFNSLASVFLQVFIFKIKGLYGVGLFNLTALSLLLIVYVSSGWFLRNHSSRTLIRVGLLLYSLGWLTLMLLKEGAANNIFLVGVIFGIAAGSFWSGFNLSQYVMTIKKSRTNYFSKVTGMRNLATTVAPLLGGLIIFIFNKFFVSTNVGYYVLFAIVTVLSMYTLLLATALPRHSGINFSIGHILYHKRNTKWKLILTGQFLWGIYDVAAPILIGILLFTLLRDEFALGLVTTTMGALSAIAGFALGQVVKKYFHVYLPGAIAVSMGMIVLAVFFNHISVFFMMILVGLGNPLVNIPQDIILFNSFDEVKEHWRNKYHLLLERDIALGIARIIIFSLILFFFVEKQDITQIRQWLLIISVFPVMTGGILYLINRQ